MTQLKRLGLPVICIDARRAKRRIKRAGWFEEISVKDLDGHSVRALLASLALLSEQFSSASYGHAVQTAKLRVCAGPGPE